MKRLIVVGAGGHARAVIDAAYASKEWIVEGVVDLKFDGTSEEVLGVPVIGGAEMIPMFEREDYWFFVAIGGNHERFHVSESLKKFQVKYANVIHPLSYVSSSASLGVGNFLGAFSNIGPSVSIGSFCIVNTSANLEHEVSVGDFSQFAPHAVVCGRSFVGSKVFLGTNAAVCLLYTSDAADE